MYSSDRICGIVNRIAFDSLVDIGTDHCYIPILAFKKGLIKRALAMDINKGPLLKAGENVNKNGLGDVIELRLSDGLFALTFGEGFKTLVIAGLGGFGIIEILNKGEKLLPEFSQIILQPQSDTELVRRRIHKASFSIFGEEIIYDCGKPYNIIDCRPGPDLPYSDWDYKLGKLLIEGKSDNFLRYLKHSILKHKRILNNIAQGGGESDKVSSLKEYIEKCEEIYGDS